RATLWWRALKIPMYSVCVAPLIVAASLCHHWYGCVNASQFGLFALGGCLVIAWLNLSNDAWDAATGVDDDKEMDGGGKPESIVRLMGGDVHAVNKVSLLAVGCLLSGIGALVMASTVDVAGVSSNVLSMLGVAVLCGQAYQGPPFRMSYKGLGEPLCFAAFGPLATGAFYLALAAGTGGSVWVNAPLTPVLSQGGVFGAAIMVGLTTTCILFTSHFHQEAGDRAAGKMSPVVKLGLERAIRTLRCALAIGMGWIGALPRMGALAVFLCSPLAIAIARYATEHEATPERLFKTKYLAVRWHAASSLAMAIGIWLDPWFP
ncbi:uncharacterized protein MICPUCDRAFT_5008, partial [Micromonas pusilla CCMP1545]